MLAPSFAEVLDDALARAHAQAHRAVSWSAAARGYADPLRFAPPMPSAAAWSRAYPRSSEPPRPVQPPPRLSARRLSPDAQQALARLVALGARLTEAFTADDLKREYRRLAMHHHPDRRHGDSADGRARAAMAFADVTDAYRRLCRAIELRH